MMFDYDDGCCPHGYDYYCMQCECADQLEKEQEYKIRTAFTRKIIKLNAYTDKKQVYDYVNLGMSKILDESDKAFRVLIYKNNNIAEYQFFTWIPKSSFILFINKNVGELDTLKKIYSLKRLPNVDDEGEIMVNIKFGCALRKKIIKEYEEIKHFNEYEKLGGKYYI